MTKISMSQQVLSGNPNKKVTGTNQKPIASEKTNVALGQMSSLIKQVNNIATDKLQQEKIQSIQAKITDGTYQINFDQLSQHILIDNI